MQRREYGKRKQTEPGTNSEASEGNKPRSDDIHRVVVVRAAIVLRRGKASQGVAAQVDNPWQCLPRVPLLINRHSLPSGVCTAGFLFPNLLISCGVSHPYALFLLNNPMGYRVAVAPGSSTFDSHSFCLGEIGSKPSLPHRRFSIFAMSGVYPAYYNAARKIMTTTFTNSETRMTHTLHMLGSTFTTRAYHLRPWPYN